MRLSILNDPKTRMRFEQKKEKYLVKGDGCWTWLSNCKTQQGYPLQSIGGRKGYCERVSRIMLFLQSPPDNETMYALHHCDNPACVNPSHLYWGTAKQNTHDAISRGRIKNPPVVTREKSSRCYIKTKEDIDRLKEWCEVFTLAEIAQKLNKSIDGTRKLLMRLNLKSKIKTQQKTPCRKGRPSSFEEPSKEKELISLSAKMTVSELSLHYGAKRDTIYTQLKRLGITPLKKRGH